MKELDVKELCVTKLCVTKLCVCVTIFHGKSCV